MTTLQGVRCILKSGIIPTGSNDATNKRKFEEDEESSTQPSRPFNQDSNYTTGESSSSNGSNGSNSSTGNTNGSNYSSNPNIGFPEFYGSDYDRRVEEIENSDLSNRLRHADSQKYIDNFIFVATCTYFI
jgi:hypothetical protein